MEQINAIEHTEDYQHPDSDSSNVHAIVQFMRMLELQRDVLQKLMVFVLMQPKNKSDTLSKRT